MTHSSPALFEKKTWNQLATVSTCPKMLCLCQCRISADSSLLASPMHLYRVVSCQVQASASLLVLLAATFQIVQMLLCEHIVWQDFGVNQRYSFRRHIRWFSDGKHCSRDGCGHLPSGAACARRRRRPHLPQGPREAAEVLQLQCHNGDERPDGVGHAQGEEGREPVRPGDQQRHHAQHGRLQAP